MRRFVVLLIVGCGGGGGGGPDGAVDDDGAARDGAPDDDGAAPRPFVPLANRSWSLQPSTESFFCVGTQLTEELWITAFRPIATDGTYSQLLTATDTPQPDGPFGCDATGAGERLLFTSGVGTEDLVFPAGTAMRVEAGKYLRLTILAVNFGATELTGSAGIDIQTIAPDQVTQQAEAFFTGTFNDFGGIPANGQPFPIGASCSIPLDWHVIAVMPRMRQYGTSIQVRHETGQGDLVNAFVDGPFTDDSVDIYPIGITIPTNDQLEVICTYTNNGAGPVGFADSVTAEECLVATYVAPAQGVGKFFCGF